MKQDRASREKEPRSLGSKRGRQVLSCGGNRAKTHPSRPPSRGPLTGRGPSSYVSSRADQNFLRPREGSVFIFLSREREGAGWRLCKYRVGKSHLQSERACVSRQEWRERKGPSPGDKACCSGWEASRQWRVYSDDGSRNQPLADSHLSPTCRPGGCPRARLL